MNEREITSHQTNDVNARIAIRADERSHGNASHAYSISWVAAGDRHVETSLQFQNGPIGEVGVNGITNEALIAIVIDRLQGFQSGPDRCRENAVARTKLEEAAMWLESRTKSRLARGVEGTHAV